jgi:SAM-dependent methyltransferase
MLPKWRRRVLVYKLFSFLPFGNRLFNTVQATVSLNRNFDLARRHYSIVEMAYMLAQAGKSVQGKNLVEIGAGWHPLLPALFYGMGANRIVMTDIVQHMKQSYVEQTMNYLIANASEIANLTCIPANQLLTRWNGLHPHGKPWLKLWNDRGIEYHAPFDFRKTNWQANSVDMIYSNSCISYIPKPSLEKIFQESVRILKPGGWIAHNLMPYDDYASSDSSITPLNFLRYDEETWERIGNSGLHYQNRLRPIAYLSLIERYGLAIQFLERRQHHLNKKMLIRSELDDEFRYLPDEELLCAHFLMVAEKPFNL